MAHQTITDTSLTFLSISEQLLNASSHSIIDKNVINKYLMELNSLNCKVFSSLENDVSMLLINRLCSNIQPSEAILVKNYSKLIANLFQNGINVSERTFLTCKQWFLIALVTNNENKEVSSQTEILMVLKTLFEVGSYDTICQDILSLLNEEGLFRTLLTRSGSNLNESTLLAINCIDVFLKNKEDNDKTLLPNSKMVIAELIISFLQSVQKNEQDQVLYYQTVCSCLRILRYLVNDKLLTDTPNMSGVLLGIVQVFLFYGIDGYLIMKPKQLRPAAMVIPEQIASIPRHVVQNPNNSRTKRHQQLKGKKSDMMNNSLDSRNTSSDSDTSDAENVKPSRAESMIRTAALHLLIKIIQQVPPREMFGYWPQIIVSTTGINKRVLSSLIIKEPGATLRQLSLSTLAEAILEARTFLTYAEDTDHSAFLTFFGTVGAMIKEMHLILGLLLKTERNFAVITHALKCISALVQVTPYTRLAPKLASRVLMSCQSFINHKDPTARVAALSVFEALASKEKLTPEVVSIISRNSDKSTDTSLLSKSFSQLVINVVNQDDQHVDEVDFTDSDSFQQEGEAENNVKDDVKDDSIVDRESNICFLLDMCIKNVLNKTVQVPVRLQSLKLISALVNNDTSHLIFNHLELVSRLLADTLQDPESQVALHSCRALEKMSINLTRDDSTAQMRLNFWNITFQSIILLITSPNTNLREAACNCLGTINNQIYTQLPYDQRILIITTLFGAVRDEESVVRAAAFRSLGLLILLPALEEDTGFVMDLANLCCTGLADENLGVRVKAAWALANLSDCLIKQLKNNDIEPLPLDLLLPNLCKVSLKAAQDNNKVKCNALRAVGNVLCLCQDLDISSDISLGIDILVKCAITGNDMKVRWNACRALGFIISKKQISTLAPNWQDKTFPALCNLICHSPNFKVRTNAAWALSKCESYGKYIPFLWKNIVLALDNSHHVPNFVEYHHHDALLQQLCLTFGHVAVNTELSDLQTLWPDIKDRIPDIMVHIKYFQERVLPEETNDFVIAKLKLDNYSQTASTSNDRNIASFLSNLFDLTYIYEEHK